MVDDIRYQTFESLLSAHVGCVGSLVEKMMNGNLESIEFPENFGEELRIDQIHDDSINPVKFTERVIHETAKYKFVRVGTAVCRIGGETGVELRVGGTPEPILLRELAFTKDDVFVCDRSYKLCRIPINSLDVAQMSVRILEEISNKNQFVGFVSNSRDTESLRLVVVE